MKTSHVFFLLLLIISSSNLVTQNTVHAGLPLVVVPSPEDGEQVSSDLVFLQVLVSSKREDVEDCIVKFYLDGEYLDAKTTNWEGLTRMDILPSEGNHTWYVVAEKIGYNRYTSPTFSFSFHPSAELTIESILGNTYGEGEHPIGTTVDFGVYPNTIYSGEKTRSVFVEWRSDEEWGYNGNKNEWKLILYEDIKEKAIWETQHYVEFEIEGLGSVSKESGWYPAGSIIDVQADPGLKHFFTLWKGTGSGSYSGNLPDIQLQVFTPIIQAAYFNSENGTLVVISDYGETHGSGLYNEGDIAEFGVKPGIFYFDEDTRYVFSGWNTRYGEGYDGPNQNNSILIKSSVVQEVEWEKQHFIEINTLESGTISIESGWYEEGNTLQINATPEYGFDFEYWINDENTILSYNETFEINISSPLNFWAKFEPKKKITLEIISDFEYYTQVINYFENETVHLEVPSVVEEQNKRYKFVEWTCNSSSGYNGTQNSANYTIIKPVTQYAKWYTEFFVTSNDPLITGWYVQDKAIRLDSNNQGLYKTRFKVNGEETSSDFISVTEPMIIEVYSVINRVYLIFGGIILLLVIIGVLVYRQLSKF
jgi:hypothetical protein